MRTLREDPRRGGIASLTSEVCGGGAPQARASSGPPSLPPAGTVTPAAHSSTQASSRPRDSIRHPIIPINGTHELARCNLRVRAMPLYTENRRRSSGRGEAHARSRGRRASEDKSLRRGRTEQGTAPGEPAPMYSAAGASKAPPLIHAPPSPWRSHGTPLRPAPGHYLCASPAHVQTLRPGGAWMPLSRSEASWQPLGTPPAAVHYSCSPQLFPADSFSCPAAVSPHSAYGAPPPPPPPLRSPISPRFSARQAAAFLDRTPSGDRVDQTRAAGVSAAGATKASDARATDSSSSGVLHELPSCAHTIEGADAPDALARLHARPCGVHKLRMLPPNELGVASVAVHSLYKQVESPWQAAMRWGLAAGELTPRRNPGERRRLSLAASPVGHGHRPCKGGQIGISVLLNLSPPAGDASESSMRCAEPEPTRHQCTELHDACTSYSPPPGFGNVCETGCNTSPACGMRPGARDMATSPLVFKTENADAGTQRSQPLSADDDFNEVQVSCTVVSSTPALRLYEPIAFGLCADPDLLSPAASAHAPLREEMQKPAARTDPDFSRTDGGLGRMLDQQEQAQQAPRALPVTGRSSPALVTAPARAHALSPQVKLDATHGAVESPASRSESAVPGVEQDQSLHSPTSAASKETGSLLDALSIQPSENTSKVGHAAELAWQQEAVVAEAVAAEPQVPSGTGVPKRAKIHLLTPPSSPAPALNCGMRGGQAKSHEQRAPHALQDISNRMGATAGSFRPGLDEQPHTPSSAVPHGGLCRFLATSRLMSPVHVCQHSSPPPRKLPHVGAGHTGARQRNLESSRYFKMRIVCPE